MSSAALAPGEVVELNWQGEDLLLYRTPAGECQAIGAYCPHMGNYIPSGLAPGKSLSALLQHDELRCPYHCWPLYRHVRAPILWPAWIHSLPDQHFNAQLTVALSGLFIGAKNLALARQKANKHPGSHLQFVSFQAKFREGFAGER